MSVIKVRKLSKRYDLDSEGGAFDALEDLSFEISEGETVGIVGHNGAGKSTLLKILSGITFPSSGEGKVEGTFSSLIEVGTGFHPELSGRDNVYYNASILGLSRKEIDRLFDEIVIFSGVVKFIDQPLRTYSSGMKLRLAFSIMAHVKTDIIALDEVLAVGDSMFQVKCLEKIFDFKNQGRTVLFVSHNLNAVKKLCDRTLVLQNGKLIFDGSTEGGIEAYLSLNQAVSDASGILKQIEVKVESEKVNIKLELEGLTTTESIDLGINITTIDGNPIYHFSNRFIDKSLVPKNGRIESEIRFSHQVKPGEYPIAVYVGQADRQLLWKENAAKLIVPPNTPYGFYNSDVIQAPVISDFKIEQL